MSILVLAEHDNTQLKSATLNAVTAAVQIGGEVHVLVAGSGCGAAGEAAAKVVGVSKVLVADDPSLAHQLAENLAPVIASAVKAGGYSHLLAPACSVAKAVMPRVAARLDVMQISEISAVFDASTFERPIYAGNALATVQSRDPIKVVTVRTTKFAPAAATGGSASVETVGGAIDAGLSSFVSQELTKSVRPELTSARIVVSGGRGVGSAGGFGLLDKVADKLGAAVGASRAAVDSGFAPNDYQVGQTGKVVAPDVYIAVGISGAIQHLAGMKDSKVIVAINKDPEAPIFNVADYGLVADLHEALPELAERLSS
ncbi:electron transfer flavoprotein subunit alpha/FixB family protein [Azoarcus sp. KH32C]|uniref:electron transfer flavoprotein subunit alpha/FixB family protein n=1 Tax=Azoarcus sp. KH32C TaxID=748247 RepID=UPI0002385D81|nr:FAD-binding protein [Azoarcus sp. KH32C]BAL27057.1 electron transfer flavoprotein, alpha subunit [Azoarcus sp. KH32C]